MEIIILPVVSATFLLVGIVNLNKSTYETSENVFYFTSEALFVLSKIKSLEFQCILLNNLGK